MSLSKQGTNYESFSYLDKGRDYKTFDLAAEVDRVPSHLISLAADDEARVNRLIEDNVLI